MARNISQKITVFAILAAVLLAHPACAKENFVSYKEAAPVLASKAPEPAEPGTVQQEELRAELTEGKSLLLFDARTKDEYDRERMPHARLPRDGDYYREAELFKQKITREAPDSKRALERATKDLPRDAAIVTYCHAHCGLSKNLKLDLEGLGFTNVRWLDGGIDVWREKGYPLEKN